jgi:transposase
MLTRQEAEEIYDAGKETVVRVLLYMGRRIHVLEHRVDELQAQVQILQEQVAKDSHNSHKPPSSEGLAKPKPKSLRPKSERPTGGQPGHPGRTLRMVENPDRIVPHRVERCANCGRRHAGQLQGRLRPAAGAGRGGYP